MQMLFTEFKNLFLLSSFVFSKICKYKGLFGTKFTGQKLKTLDFFFIYECVQKVIACSLSIFSIDGGDSSDGIARYVNDSPKKFTNCYPKPMPKLLQIHLYSSKDIQKGEELRYSYAMKEMPWRNKVRTI